MIADIDECETEEHNCDDANATCINNIGSFTCTCKPGYSLADGVKCRGKYSAENISLSCNPFQIDPFLPFDLRTLSLLKNSMLQDPNNFSWKAFKLTT